MTASTRGRKPHLHSFAGQMLTLKEIAAKTGVNRNTLAARLYHGMTIEDAASSEARDRKYPANARRYIFAGKTLTIGQWAKETGINLATLRDRIDSYRWPIERALTEPVMRKGQRQRHQRNAEIIRRMLQGFSHAGGYVETFTPAKGTGAGRHALHLQTEKELSP